MKVDLKSSIFPCQQNSAGLADVEDALLTEHINVVHQQLPRGHQTLDMWDLVVDDIISRFLCFFAPELKLICVARCPIRICDIIMSILM